MSESKKTTFLLAEAMALHKKIINRISDPFQITGKEIEEIRSALEAAYDKGARDGQTLPQIVL